MTVSTRLRLLGLGVIAASMLAAPSAHAAIAGATPSNFTDRPTLTGATIREDHNVGIKSADFCFDRNVSLTEFSQHGFALVGYAWDNVNRSTSAAIEFGAHNCVRAQFNLVEDVVNATIGTVDENAVMGDTGGPAKGNHADAAPLAATQQGQQLGNTVGPNFVSVSVDPTLNQIRVKYDRVVNIVGEAWHFHYYDQAGNRVDATKALNAGAPAADTLVLTFPASLSRNVRDAVRLATDGDSIYDASGQLAPIQWAAILNGGETARPDLVGARISGPNSVDYTFDEPVKIDDVDHFLIYDPNHGQLMPSTLPYGLPSYVGTDATILNSNQHVVRVWFGPQSQGLFANGLVLAAVKEGAVESNDSAHLNNSIGAIGIGSLPHTAGYTSAPDATKVVFNKDDGTASITFDQMLIATPLDSGCDLAAYTTPRKPGDRYRCTDFHLYDNSGNELGHAQRIQSVVTGTTGSTTVVILFGQDRVENAQAVGLDRYAVEGLTGDLSVAQVLARTPTPPTPPAGGGQVSTPAQGSLGASQVGISPSATAPTKAGLRIASAKLMKAKSLKAKRVLRLRVSGKASTAKVRVRIVSRTGKLVRTVTKTVRTNRTVSIVIGRLAKGQRVHVRLV